MPLTGSNKKEYQRKYMQAKRSNGTGGLTSGSNIEVDAEKAAKLLMIARSLGKEYIALDGKKGKLSDLVRYGINGPTMTEVREKLE